MRSISFSYRNKQIVLEAIQYKVNKKIGFKNYGKVFDNINDVIDIRIRMNYAENVWDILPNCNISLQKLKEAWKNLCY